MKRKFLAIFLCLALAAGVMACGGDKAPANTGDMTGSESISQDDGPIMDNHSTATDEPGDLPSDNATDAADDAQDAPADDAAADEDKTDTDVTADSTTDNAADSTTDNTSTDDDQASTDAGTDAPSTDDGADAPTDADQATDDVQAETDTDNNDLTEEGNFVYEVVLDIPEGFDRMHTDSGYYKIKEIQYESKTTGTKRKANILTPPDYSEDKEYPVLYLLHGIGGDHREWMGGAPIQVVTNLVNEGLAPDMIVVIPNVRARAKDAGNPSDIYTAEHFKAFDNFINDLRDDLMPYIEANYSIKTGKENTAIAGLSMGGRESLYIGFTMPEIFGYIGAFEPAPGLLHYTNFGVTEDGLFTEETFKLPEGADNFVLIVKGNQDTVVGNFPADYHNALEKNGVEHVYYTMDGGHDFTVWKHGLYNFLRGVFK